MQQTVFQQHFTIWQTKNGQLPKHVARIDHIISHPTSNINSVLKQSGSNEIWAYQNGREGEPHPAPPPRWTRWGTGTWMSGKGKSRITTPSPPFLLVLIFRDILSSQIKPTILMCPVLYKYCILPLLVSYALKNQDYLLWAYCLFGAESICSNELLLSSNHILWLM